LISDRSHWPLIDTDEILILAEVYWQEDPGMSESNFIRGPHAFCNGAVFSCVCQSDQTRGSQAGLNL
jgi:hypothetical protein